MILLFDVSFIFPSFVLLSNRNYQCRISSLPMPASLLTTHSTYETLSHNKMLSIRSLLPLLRLLLLLLLLQLTFQQELTSFLVPLGDPPPRHLLLPLRHLIPIVDPSCGTVGVDDDWSNFLECDALCGRTKTRKVKNGQNMRAQER